MPQSPSRAGKKRITTYRRIVRDDGSLNEKFPGGVQDQATHLRAEGFQIEPARGKQPPKVKDVEKHITEL